MNGPRQPEGQRQCVGEFMRSSGAAQEAVDFFTLSGTWLVAFITGPGKIDAGLTQAPGMTTTAPQLVFLNGDPRSQAEQDLFNRAFPQNPKDGTSPFKNDPMFPALFAAAEKKFLNADDPFDLQLFDDNLLESFSALGRGGEEFVVEAGIHNFCHDCGIGVAARFVFDFDANGHLTTIRLQGLCQGRQVTEDVAGIGRITFHDFSGIKVQPGGTGVSEPYRVTVPELAGCPNHLNF